MAERYLHDYKGRSIYQNTASGMYYYMSNGHRIVFDDYDDLCLDIDSGVHV